MRLASTLSLATAVLAAGLYVAVMERKLAPEWGLLPVLPPAYLAIALGIFSLKREKAARWVAWAGLVLATPVALMSTALVIFL